MSTVESHSNSQVYLENIPEGNNATQNFGEPEEIINENQDSNTLEVNGDSDGPAEDVNNRFTSDDSETEIDENNMQENLTQWAIKHQVSHAALNDLLRTLKGHHCFRDLPKDPRTLLKTPRRTILEEMPPGNYVHFGLEHAIKALLGRLAPNEVFIQIGIDGIPVQKSNNAQFWPILVHISSPKLSVESVGIYSGKSKPQNVSQYLQKLVQEMKVPLHTGFQWNGNQVKVLLEAFVCDAPARAFITATKNHTGYRGCSKCYVKGVWRNKVVFLETDAKRRTDELFRSRDDPLHHNGQSIIEELPINMIARIPLDYMHLICLGVMRKLMCLWTKGPAVPFKISANQHNQISKKLEQCSPYFGKEFARKSRSLKELDHWKATEFRNFLLYSGPVVLKDILLKNCYQNFLCLHVSVTILCCPIKIKQYLQYARSLLVYFVKTFIAIYGEQNTTYNIHNLIHISDDAEMLGVLDSFSAFRFENKLGQIKQLLKKPNYLLQQIHRRLAESTERNILPQKITKRRRWTGCEAFDLKEQYKNVLCKGFEILCQQGDNFCLLTDGSVVLVASTGLNDLGEEFIIGQKFLQTNNVYSTPCQSRLCGILAVHTMSSMKQWKLSDVAQKCISFPNSLNSFIIFPILHTDDIYLAARNQDPPNRKLWKRFAVKVYHEFDNYDNAVAEIPHFLNFFDYEAAESSQTCSKSLGIISGTNISKTVDSDSGSDESISSMSSKFTFGPVELPTPPEIKKITSVVSRGAGKVVQHENLFPLLHKLQSVIYRDPQILEILKQLKKFLKILFTTRIYRA
ncbi:unnamed protein product [Allacma fusca]|uniref:Transposase domain-containing protein n=1 Tax=Allacma fusca TaxID=39272 RepID=A0A8J2K624_9HEXA|nr:unnamed protein product [Allacma fusca]